MHISFAHLLEKLHKVQGLNRIRFTTSHPRDFHEDLISAIADLDSVCEHVHLPLQAGSDRILKAMRRGYTLDYYLGKVTKLRSRIPKIAITSDIIVGFPGETEDDFLQTFEALQQIRFDQIFSFKYSPRPGTGASSLPEQVPEEAKTSRLAEVQTLQDQITQHYHKLAEGTEEEVLIEGIRIKTGQPFGRTRTNKIVNLESSQDIGAGETVKAKIIRGLKHSLIGRKIS
jgi:tRNA-2-methylthio-N6-dimethylallyladenosine synthase